MSKEKLFEIKMHGLPRRKRRELEATLRDFAAGIGDGSTDASPSHKRTSTKHGSTGRGSSTSNSKHPSSSTSNYRPTDSAYASASTGPSSAAPHSTTTASIGRPSVGRSRSSDQKVDAYLKGIPEGMYPQRQTLTNREKKKWVVKRLEQLFTGKLANVQITPGIDRHVSDTTLPPVLEASREALMQQPELGKKHGTRDRSANDSNGEQTDSRDNGTGGGSGSGSGSGSGGRSGINTSSPADLPPDQRPTRVGDLDPDRVQIPADNLDYMKHVSGVAKGSSASRAFRSKDVSMDAEGWFHVNLLSNMAQLHMMNVTPAFVRQAVSEKSTRFQLSPDGQKLRWRGGTEGTKFHGDSSGDNSKHSPVTDESEVPNENGQRKRKSSDEKSAKLGLQSQNSSKDFHYKPIFVHRDSSLETSPEGTGSPTSADDKTPADNSRWSVSGTASSGRKRRRVDGAIVYYTGAPFCTDLAGDTGDVSPTTYMISTDQGQSVETGSSGLPDDSRPISNRTWSGSSLPIRPLVDGPSGAVEQAGSLSGSEPDLTMDDTDSSEDLDLDFPWCDEPGKISPKTLEPLLEPCGLGGVTPEDHFAVLAITRHPRNVRFENEKCDTTVAIANRLASLSTASPQPTGPSVSAAPAVKYHFVSAKIRSLKPMPLPQPAMFYPPFSTSSESEDESSPGSADEADDHMYDSPISVHKRANRSRSNVNTYPEGKDLSSNDEEDDAENDNGYEASVGSSVSPRTRTANVQRRQKSASIAASASVPASGRSVEAVRAGSSLATAGDAGSLYHATN